MSFFENDNLEPYIGKKGKMMEFIKIYQKKGCEVKRSSITIDLTEVASYEDWGEGITRVTLKGSHLCFKVEEAYDSFKKKVKENMKEFIKIYKEKDGTEKRSRISIDLTEVASCEDWGEGITRVTLKGNHLCLKIEESYDSFKEKVDELK